MTQWRREPATLWRRSGQAVVLLPPGADEALVVQGVGALVWLLLEEPMPEEELVNGLAEDFATDPEQVRHELRSFGEDLAARGALHLDAGAAVSPGTDGQADTEVEVGR